MKALSLLVALVVWACADGDSGAVDTVDAELVDVIADVVSDSRQETVIDTAEDALDETRDGADTEPPEYVPPSPDFPDEGDERPFTLSQAGLFDGSAPAPDLIAFLPTYVLWADGLGKGRWLRLPAGAAIDTRVADAWQLPVGAVVFKEFGTDTRPLETRVIARTGPGPFDYWMGAFVWRDDGSDADFVRAGAVDVGGTDHDVPSAERCWACHAGTPGRVLGLSALQLAAEKPGHVTLAELAERFTTALPDIAAPPGEPLDAAALGYLHANCGHCHSPTGVARPDTDLDLSLSLDDLALEDTGAFVTAVGVATRSWQRDDYPLRVAPGDPAHSALIARMRVRGNTDQMPPLATEHVDEAALAILSEWIASLPDP